MKIMLISSSSGSLGGGELYLIKLASVLGRQGHQLSLACSDHERMDALAGRFREIGDVFRFYYKNTYDYPLRSLHHFWCHQYFDEDLSRAVTSFKPDVIHLNKQNLEDGLDLLKWIYDTELPSLQTIHVLRTPTELGAKFGGLRDLVTQRFLKKYQVATILAASKHEREKFSQQGLIAEGKTRYIANGVEDSGRRGGARKSMALQFVAVSRLHEQKRPFLWLDWVKKIQSHSPDAVFHWIGNGHLESAFLEKIDSEKIANIHYHGWLDNPLELLSKADFMLHSASYEGQPFALLEAFSMGIPVIVDRCLYESQSEMNPGMIEIDRFLQSPHDLPDGETYEGLSREARMLYENEFSAERLAEETLSLYRSLAGG